MIQYIWGLRAIYTSVSNIAIVDIHVRIDVCDPWWFQYTETFTNHEITSSAIEETHTISCPRFPSAISLSNYSFHTVGSQAQGLCPSSPNFWTSLSSSSKSKTFEFSTILSGVTDFGNGTNSCHQYHQYNRPTQLCFLGSGKKWLTICKLHLTKICAGVFSYFFASSTTKGSSNRCPLTTGQ